MEVALVTLQPENLSAELVQNFGAGEEEEKPQHKHSFMGCPLFFWLQYEAYFVRYSGTVDMGSLVAQTVAPLARVSPCPQPSQLS